jgi:hypothetical protein
MVRRWLLPCETDDLSAFPGTVLLLGLQVCVAKQSTSAMLVYLVAMLCCVPKGRVLPKSAKFEGSFSTAGYGCSDEEESSRLE